MSGWIIAVVLVVGTALAAYLMRLHRELRAAREAFEVLSRRAPIGIVRSDAQGMCTYANDQWCEISGLSLAETLGRRWSQAVHPDDLPAVVAKWEESVRERRPYVNELRLVHPDGSVRHVVAGACPTHDEQGSVTGFIGSVLDVTERRSAEQRARESQSLLHSLVEHSSAAIYLKDTAGCYLLVNRKHAEIWPPMRGFRPGTTPYDWFPEEIARSFIESDAEVWKNGKARTFEETIVVGGEPRTFLSVKFPVFDDGGRVTAVGGVSADITEFETTRRELRERERLLRGLIEVQENERQHICHEFHDGLIQYAVGSKMLLEGLLAAGLPEAARPAIDSVVDCLAKGIEDGRRVIRGIRPAALDDLGLRAALEELVADMQEAGLEVEARFDPAIDAITSALQTTVYRVVQESLNNARKHSGSRQVSVAVTVSDARIDVTVADRGRGFDPATAASAGFGLAGVRERVRLAGGQCVLEAAPGEGTRIAVRLPLGSHEPAAVEV